MITQPSIARSDLTIETLGQAGKYMPMASFWCLYCSGVFYSRDHLTKFIQYFARNNCLQYPDWISTTACKVSKYGVISSLYFPVFGLNTEIYPVNLRIQSEYRKRRTRKISVFGHFSSSAENYPSHFHIPLTKGAHTIMLNQPVKL